MAHDFVPFSIEEAIHGREAAHAKYPGRSTRISDQDLPTLCRLAGIALSYLRTWHDEGRPTKKWGLGQAVNQAFSDIGFTSKTEESRVKRQLYVQAIAKMFADRRAMKLAAQERTGNRDHAPTAPASLAESAREEPPEQLNLL